MLMYLINILLHFKFGRNYAEVALAELIDNRHCSVTYKVYKA